MSTALNVGHLPNGLAFLKCAGDQPLLVEQKDVKKQTKTLAVKYAACSTRDKQFPGVIWTIVK